MGAVIRTETQRANAKPAADRAPGNKYRDTMRARPPAVLDTVVVVCGVLCCVCGFLLTQNIP